MKYVPREKYQSIIVIFCIAVLHISLGMYKILPLRPQSIHQWAQCDRASVALNYYHDGMDFFHPAVHNLDNGTGVTGMEFPFVNYTAAMLYKIFGFHEWLYRLLTLLIYSIGLYCAFKIANWWLKNYWQSIGVMLLFGCSPLLAFYSANFLPEPSTLGFSMLAWFFLTRFIDTNVQRWLWWCTAAMTLACLIKLSALINMPAMAVLIWMNTEQANRKTVFLNLFLKSVIIVGLTFSWYRYAMLLSIKTHSEIFLLKSMFPQNWNNFKDVWNEMRAVWFMRIYNDFLLVLMLISLFVGVLARKIISKQIFVIGGVLLFSVLAFLLSMWTQLRHHDYYMIPMYPLFLFGLIMIVSLINTTKQKVAPLLFLVFFIGFTSFQYYEAKTHIRTCYRKDSWKYSPIQFDQFFDFKAQLVNCGVKPSDRIISVFDHTPDNSLYLMDQKGVTVSDHDFDEFTNKYLNTGIFTYLIYNAASEIEGYRFQPAKYQLQFVYRYGYISIYHITLKLTPSQKSAIAPPCLSPWN
ncbi:hypothetical protein BH11BAC2_BH11BAC2_10700 [soil metagenome]